MDKAGVLWIPIPCSVSRNGAEEGWVIPVCSGRDHDDRHQSPFVGQWPDAFQRVQHILSGAVGLPVKVHQQATRLLRVPVLLERISVQGGQALGVGEGRRDRRSRGQAAGNHRGQCEHEQPEGTERKPLRSWNMPPSALSGPFTCTRSHMKSGPFSS